MGDTCTLRINYIYCLEYTVELYGWVNKNKKFDTGIFISTEARYRRKKNRYD
jgi:hypothetical protein